MKLFDKIICAVDFDESSTVVLRFARELAQQNGATLFVLHVALLPLNAREVEEATVLHIRGFEECTVGVIAALDDRCGVAAMRIPPKTLSAIAAEGMIMPSAVRALDRYAADLGSDIRPVTDWASHLRLPPCDAVNDSSPAAEGEQLVCLTR